MVRWLERVEHVNTDAVRARMTAAGLKHQQDSALLGFMESKGEISRDRLSATILSDITRQGLAMGACGVKRAGLRLVLRNGCVVTVLGPNEDEPGKPIYPYRGAL
jgi:hypothetical protein